MIKGFIDFDSVDIPFVIDDENYCMELFSNDNNILDQFVEKYNLEKNYTLSGKCFRFGQLSQKIDILVDRSIGTEFYLRCYIIYNIDSCDYDNIRIQSAFLDGIFRYKYNYIDSIKKDNSSLNGPLDIYKFNFFINNKQYELIYRIGQNYDLGLLTDFNKNGEIKISQLDSNIKECDCIVNTLYRLVMFMTSDSKVSFKKILLYEDNYKVGELFCPLISDIVSSGYDIIFCKYDGMNYIPKILNNIADDCNNEITKSIPLGHLSDLEAIYSPQRFIEQIISFEYLFDKLEHEKAQNRQYPLKAELEDMFAKFPDLVDSKSNINVVSQKIKELRREITHGYKYYYDFQNDPDICNLMRLVDKLIKKMSLLYMGFGDEDIKKFPYV